MSAVGSVAARDDVIVVGEQELRLSAYEQRLLKCLLEAGEGQLRSKAELDAAMYQGRESNATSNVIEVLISRCRRALKLAGANVAIDTVRSRGYLLRQVHGAQS